MKKGVVGVLIFLAVVVLISPVIVGRMAEKSMDENLNWAAQESGDVRVTSENFSRGWFSSEGQHRVEIQDGELLTAIQGLSGPVQADEFPVLVINTKLDHGLIPVSSMGREKGSLAPRLGSAVSTLAIELADGEAVELPGTIYSKVGLGGELLSNYVLSPGSRADGDTTATWGTTNIEVQTDPKSGEAKFSGVVNSMSVLADTESVSLGNLTFEGEQQPSEYGISVGDIVFELSDLEILTSDTTAVIGFDTISLEASTRLDGDEVNADAKMSMAMKGLPQFGEMAYDLDFELAGADAEALGRMQQALDNMRGSSDPMATYATVQDDLMQLFAAGFDLNFEKLDIVLPQGTISSKMLFSFSEEDPATFTWMSLLLSTEATIDLSIPAALVDMLVQSEPNAAMAIGAGYLVKRGDAYEMNAEMKKGLLKVNGAPIPIPFGAMR